jgi:hypothetical protein
MTPNEQPQDARGEEADVLTRAAAEKFLSEIDLMNEMQLAGLPPELDQDVRDLVRLISDHGDSYKDTEHGDMTVSLLGSLNRLVQAARKGTDASPSRPIRERRRVSQ